LSEVWYAVVGNVYPRTEHAGKDYNYEDLKKENEAEYTKLVCHCVRIAFELGADIIKTQFTGSAESFSKVVEAANGTPVLIAGGKMKDENELYAMVSDSIKAGGAGVSIGRNVFNREDSLEVIERLRKIVFD
jgi:class I fructose-bisphosphate aldolase